MAKASELLPGASFGYLTDRDPSAYKIEAAITNAVTVIERRKVFVNDSRYSARIPSQVEAWVVSGGRVGYRNGLTRFYASAEAVRDRDAKSVGFCITEGRGWIPVATLREMLVKRQAVEAAQDESRKQKKAIRVEMERAVEEFGGAFAVGRVAVSDGWSGDRITVTFDTAEDFRAFAATLTPPTEAR